ncbi:MAG TPA: peptide-methionine (S)-S-oxide reductase MsrA [Isosphaeraceae bacterium]|jgi:peptide-methionine (S)-S-oxide reductase|nr:peptide-methionine (S)-S-oxide reductase MsrA [Isosphaeraceae bacterium]
MSFRFLATTFGIAAALGFAALAPAQEATRSSRTQRPQDNAKATDEAKGTAKAGEKDKDKAAKPEPKTELATFGGGCFWCMEAVFERIPGVKNVVSGYSGGIFPNPSYELVHTGQTGHAEVIQLEYDPAVVSYDELLKWFFKSHDPTTLNRQGPDEGTQYRSVIFYHTEEQKTAALAMYQKLTKARHFPDPIVTELAPFKAFYPAEPGHQDFYRRNRNLDHPYVESIIKPKLRHLTPKPAPKAKAKAKPKPKADAASASK